MIAVIAFLSAACFGSANAKSVFSCRHDKGWHERVQAEKIAFLTTKMELTSEEAEKFWPLYNEMEKERGEAFSATMKAYKALQKALEQGASQKEIGALLEKYTNAIKDSRSVEAKYTPIFRKVISVEKVAKLYIGEEEFRRTQIHRWHSKK